MTNMEAHARFSFLGTCAVIAMICCCIAGIMGEIKDGFVYTDLLKTVRRGDKTSLKCEFLGAPVAVYWKKGNDPDQSPTLITWMDGRKWQGDCAENNWCDIDENFYLIIRNATIAHTGRYICRVSNYLGHLIHNITDLHVFEPPAEPYPVIKECNNSSALGKDYGCVIRSSTPINLTCLAFGFFPELDLFFLHGSEKITSMEIQEWTNDDGTRSKSVSISAVPHDTSYVCIASDVPGNQEERAVTVFVTPLQNNTSASKGSTAKPPKEITVVIITVPIVIVTIPAVCMLIVCWRRHNQKDRRGPNDEESFPLIEKRTLKGKLSFYDIWIVVSRVTASDMGKLHKTLKELGIRRTGRKKELTPRKAYKHLCKWKIDCVNDNQSKILKTAMKKSGYYAAWKDICELRRKQEVLVSEGTLEHILWEIGDSTKIHAFLSELIPGRTTSDSEVIENNISPELVLKALGELKEWSKLSFDVHPFTLLSLALESAECCPVDRTFFEGKLSFYHLWAMVSEATTSDMAKLHDTLREIGITRVGLQEALTHQEVYDYLCKWKIDCVDDHQSLILQAAMEKSGYSAAWKEIYDLKRNQEVTVSEGTLEHILWEIGDSAKIHAFLSKLIPGRTTSDSGVIENNITPELVLKALAELKEWSKWSFDVHPFTLLSLALESAGCCPVDRTFFAVSDSLISSDEVSHFVKKLTRRHCEKLSILVKLTSHEITTIVDENNRALFDTESMISDWVAQQNCSHTEMRFKLNHAAISIGRHDLKGHFTVYDDSIANYSETGHGKDGELEKSKEAQRNAECGNDVTDAELQRIVKYVGPKQIPQLFGTEGDCFTVLKAWIEKQSKARPSPNCRDILRQQLKKIRMQDLIPLEIKEDIYLVELADVALRLLMTDVFPLGTALNISGHKMKSYHRTPMDESNLSKGTIKVLVIICKGKKFARSELCGALSKVDGCEEIAHLLKYGHELSQGDLSAVGYGDEGIAEKCAKISEKLQISTKTTDTMEMLRYWRSLIKPPTYNSRTVLADAVLSVLGKERALSILSGKIRRNGTQSGNVISFIRDSIWYVQGSRVANILGVGRSSSTHGKLSIQQLFNSYRESLKKQPLNDAARETLCRRLYEGGYKNFSSKLLDDKLQESQTSDALEQMEKAMENDVATALAEMLGVELQSQSTSYAIKDVLDEWQEDIRKKPMEQQERIDLGNKLFKEGYMEFSLEIMIGFVPKPLETTVGEKIKEAATLSAKHLIQATFNTAGLVTSEIIPSFV